MSDVQQGPGWWQASDSKWYPPPAPSAPMTAPPPPTAGKKKGGCGKVLLIGLGLLVLLIAIAAVAGGGSKKDDDSKVATEAADTMTGDTPPAGPTAAPVPAAPATTTAQFATFGDGSHTVGKDIQPGTYRLRKDPSLCYWSRLAGFSGELNDIIANENTSGPAVVDIAPTDKGFKSQGCGKWTADLSIVTKAKNSVGDGTWIVGTDLDPGTYQSNGSGSCYWARLSNFSGELGGVIANENTSGSATVTVAAGDRGFKSQGCGTFTKSG